MGGAVLYSRAHSEVFNKEFEKRDEVQLKSCDGSRYVPGGVLRRKYLVKGV